MLVGFKYNNIEKPQEALVTAFMFDTDHECFKLSLLGIDDTGYNYTIPGEAYFEIEDFNNMMENGELEFPHEVIGRKLKINVHYSPLDRKIIDEIKSTRSLMSRYTDEDGNVDLDALIEEGEVVLDGEEDADE